MVRPKGRAHEHSMAERPQAGVCQAIVIPILLLLSKPKAPEGVAWGVRWHLHVVVRVNHSVPADETTKIVQHGGGGTVGHWVPARHGEDGPRPWTAWAVRL